ncbi:MAG: prohibitin family protein [candidate division SR1 bacterium]|nr:prohibitin family protein [candidate division SR1 bacterium]RKW22198.1 MAG: prohibitin family protein [Candidatus Gracilibacteria bacterium]
MNKEENYTWLKWLIGLFVAVVVLVAFRPFTTVKSTERGVVYKFGAVNSKLGEGLHFVIPFVESVKKIPITPQEMDLELPVAENGAITKDNQTIGANISIFYRFNDAEILDLAKNYGVDIVKQKVQKDTLEAFKQAIGQNTIFDVAQNQEKIRSQVKKMTNEKIGEYPVVIDDIKISNYDWSEEFDNQIASTMKIAQEAKQQEQQLKKVEIEAQQAVKKAEANKEAERLNAEAMELKGKGVRAYNDAITSNQRNMELEIQLKKLEIEKIKAEKWNGQYVPINNYGPIPVSRNRANQGE